jgi:hypothetical protein
MDGLIDLSVNFCYLCRCIEPYTVKKAQCNFQFENHVTFHVIGIKIVYNVKIIYISADVKLNSIEFTRYYIVHNVIKTNFTLYMEGQFCNK